MDSNKIWKLFENKDEEREKEIFDYTKHPAYGLLMFKKVLKNSEKIMDIVTQLSQNQDEKINDIGMEFVYLNAWEYLSKTEIEKENVITSLQFIYTPEIDNYLSKTKSYFEDLEDYEKCAFIHKLQTSIQNNVANPKDFH
jgi:hypothetical protein